MSFDLSLMKTPILVLLLLYFGFAVGAAERNPPSAQEVIIDLDPSKSTVQFALSAVLHTRPRYVQSQARHGSLGDRNW